MPPAARIRDQPVQQFGTVRLFDAPPINPARLFRITDTPPTLRTIPQAVVTRHALDRPQWQGRVGNPVRQSGGLYDAADRIVPVSPKLTVDAARLLVMPDDPPMLESGRRGAAERLIGPHVYGGEIKTHFGHFLLESLCRAWAFADRPPGARIVFHGPKGGPDTILAPFMRVILASVGVYPDDVVIADRDLVVDELVLPSSQYGMPSRADRGYADLFGRIRERLAPRNGCRGPERLYLTRRLVSARALRGADQPDRPSHVRERALAKMLADEAAVEALFMKRGFLVVAPETLPVAEQVRLVAGAAVLAGATGTALHHALFCARPDARVVSVATRFSPNQVAIEQLKGLASAHLFCARPRPAGEAVPVALGRLAALLDELAL